MANYLVSDLEYEPVLESDAAAKEWLNSRSTDGLIYLVKKHGKVSGETCKPIDIMDASTGQEKLTTIHCDCGILPSRKTQKQYSYEQRCRLMTRLATDLESNSTVLAVLESISTGRTIRRVLDNVIPNSIKQFQYFARAIRNISHLYDNSGKPDLVVCVPADASLSVLAAKLAPAIAVNSQILVILDGLEPHISFEIKNKTTVNLALFYLLDKIATLDEGMTMVDFIYRRMSFRELTTHDYRLCVLVFDSCDIDAATEATVSALCIAAEQRLRYRILIHEGIWNDFLQRLVDRLNNLRVGTALDRNADLGPLTSEVVKATLNRLRMVPAQMREFCDIAGDFLSFRTMTEAVQLANDCSMDVHASVWTENASLAYQIEDVLRANVVWLNGIELYDASVPVGCNHQQEGTFIDGGLRSIYPYSTSMFSIQLLDTNTSLDESKMLVEATVASKNARANWNKTSFTQRSEFLRNALQAVDQIGRLSNELEYFYYWEANCGQPEVQVNIQRSNCKGRATVKYLPLGSVIIIIDDEHLEREPLMELFASAILAAIAHGNSVVAIINDFVFKKDYVESHINCFRETLASAGLPLGVLNLVICNSPLGLWNSADWPDFNSIFFIGGHRGVIKNMSSSNVNHWDSNFLCKLLTDRREQHQNDSILQMLSSVFTKPKTVWDTFANK